MKQSKDFKVLHICSFKCTLPLLFFLFFYKTAYWSSGFNFLQVLISEAIAKYWVQKDGGDPNSFEFDVYLQRMPYPSYYDDPLIGVLQGYLPLFLILSFIISVIINVKNLVYEKERKLKVRGSK